MIPEATIAATAAATIAATPEATIAATAEATIAATAGNLSATVSENWWYFAIFGIFFLALTFSQVIFSKSESKTAGLILPGVSIGIALVAGFFPAMVSSTMNFLDALKVVAVVAVPAYFWLLVYAVVRIIMKLKK